MMQAIWIFCQLFGFAVNNDSCLAKILSTKFLLLEEFFPWIRGIALINIECLRDYHRIDMIKFGLININKLVTRASGPYGAFLLVKTNYYWVWFNQYKTKTSRPYGPFPSSITKLSLSYKFIFKALDFGIHHKREQPFMELFITD